MYQTAGACHGDEYRHHAGGVHWLGVFGRARLPERRPADYFRVDQFFGGECGRDRDADYGASGVCH